MSISVLLLVIACSWACSMLRARQGSDEFVLLSMQHVASSSKVRWNWDNKNVFSFLLLFCFMPSWAFCVLFMGRKTVGQERGLNREHFAWNYEHFTSVHEFSARRFARFPTLLQTLTRQFFLFFFLFFFKCAPGTSAVEDPHAHPEVRLRHLLAGTTIYVSSYYYICVLVLLCMCPHTTMCVLILVEIHARTCRSTSTTSPRRYYYMCVLILLYVSSYYYMCPLTTTFVSFLAGTSMCPHTNMCPHIPHVSRDTRSHLQKYVYHVAAQVLLYVCLHTTKYVSSYYYICVLILVEIHRTS
jgi:hypothetical protein